MSLLKNIQNLLAVKKDNEAIRLFALKAYEDKFPEFPGNGWRAFRKFSIKSDNEITIHYSYGAGDMEFDDSFDVLIPEDN